MTKLKIAIHTSGYRQGWVAQQIGIDPSLLSRYTSGERKAPKHHLKAIAKVIKRKIGDLS